MPRVVTVEPGTAAVEPLVEPVLDTALVLQRLQGPCLIQAQLLRFNGQKRKCAIV